MVPLVKFDEDVRKNPQRDHGYDRPVSGFPDSVVARECEVRIFFRAGHRPLEIEVLHVSRGSAASHRICYRRGATRTKFIMRAMASGSMTSAMVDDFHCGAITFFQPTSSAVLREEGNNQASTRSHIRVVRKCSAISAVVDAVTMFGK